MVGMVDFGMYPCVLALNRFFDALPPCHFQSDHLDLPGSVGPSLSVACIVDTMVVVFVFFVASFCLNQLWRTCFECEPMLFVCLNFCTQDSTLAFESCTRLLT